MCVLVTLTCDNNPITLAMEAGEEEEKKEDGRMGGEGKEEKRKEFKQSLAYMKRLKCQKPNQSQEQPR